LVPGPIGLAFEHELWLCFFAGVVRQRFADRRLPVADGPALVPGAAADAAAALQHSDANALQNL
jgi:hypothetical protein